MIYDQYLNISITFHLYYVFLIFLYQSLSNVLQLLFQRHMEQHCQAVCIYQEYFQKRYNHQEMFEFEHTLQLIIGSEKCVWRECLEEKYRSHKLLILPEKNKKRNAFK